MVCAKYSAFRTERRAGIRRGVHARYRYARACQRRSSVVGTAGWGLWQAYAAGCVASAQARDATRFRLVRVDGNVSCCARPDARRDTCSRRATRGPGVDQIEHSGAADRRMQRWRFAPEIARHRQFSGHAGGDQWQRATVAGDAMPSLSSGDLDLQPLDRRIDARRAVRSPSSPSTFHGSMPGAVRCVLS